jgi:hypothetical protein
MQNILRTCDQNYRIRPCCHDDERDCRCYDCLHMGFYSPEPDTYDCYKKLCYYIMNYGPAYASEIYHYFSQSQILENNFNGKSLNIISLGCGFSPDLIALRKYISDRNLSIKMHYLGLDNEPLWNNLRINNPCARYSLCDVLSGFNLSGYDMVFINKLYSTLKKNKHDSQFLSLLLQQIRTTLSADSFLVFTDINHRAMGRDQFDTSINRFFSRKNYYYFPVEDAYADNFTPINQTRNVFLIPRGIAVSPKPDVTKAVIFEYRK